MLNLLFHFFLFIYVVPVVLLLVSFYLIFRQLSDFKKSTTVFHICITDKLMKLNVVCKLISCSALMDDMINCVCWLCLRFDTHPINHLPVIHLYGTRGA